jgi:NADPH-dependent 2,4-dienoyl-CoA reductase/sulfur reductase-like enzyme
VSDDESRVVVVGAGPAGMAAAIAAADAGCAVTVLDAGMRPGGQYYRQPPPSFGQPLPKLIRQLVSHPGITVRSGTTVVAAQPRDGGGAVLHVLRDDESVALEEAPALVLATGAYDRPLPFPGWTLPGVFTAGGAQAMVKGQHVLPGKRVAIAGTGPFLLPVASALAIAGADVVGIFEANHPGGWARHLGAALANPTKVAEACRYAGVLGGRRIPFRYRHAVIAAHGTDRLQAVTVARLNPDWTPIPRSKRRYDVDALCIGFGFVPSVELAEGLGCKLDVDAHGAPVVATTDVVRTSVSGIFAAGEASGVGGAVLATLEGRLAGIAAAGGRSDRNRVAERRLRSRWARARAFADALDDVYALRAGWRGWLDGDTVVCRCEEVSASDIGAALDDGMAADLRSVKLHTRAGMGMCQGRMCAASLAAIIEGTTGASPDPTTFVRRPFVVPVPLSSLASLAPRSTNPDSGLSDGPAQ